MNAMDKREFAADVKAERSIIKKFRDTIWSPFVGGVKEYELIQAGDRIAVCISGGKDSMLLAKCMELLCRHSEVPFSLVFLAMDPGYNRENRALLEKNAALLKVELHLFESDIFEVAESAAGSPCYLCARMRRGFLYSKAKELSCNKIALGHHLDDAIETVLMSMMYSSEIKTMPPKLRSANFEGMELIRPLYKVKESDIIAWANYNDLRFLRCACRFTEESEQHEELSKRREIKGIIREIKKINPAVDGNIFRSLHNVDLNTLPGYRVSGQRHSFLEKY